MRRAAVAERLPMAYTRAAAVAGLLVSASLTLPLVPPAAALSASDILALPRWAVGFNWTYSYAGATNQEIGPFRATSMTDTYTSQVAGEATTPRGDAWVVRNNHTGTLTGTAYGFPATGDFTSLNFYYVRKADLAVLNSSQDLQVSARAPPFPPVQGSSYNSTYADPPLAQIAFGSPSDGTPWRITSNLTSTGWYKIGSSAQVNTFSYLALDYNLSVTAIETASVPAGNLPAYNITGGGTADNNGTVYNFTESFLYAPDALNKAIDEGGYRLQAYSVNRAPVALPLPPLGVDAGGSATLDLIPYVSDPDGDAFTLACTPSPALNCSVAPNGTLTVIAEPGLNATLFLDLTADDGRPAGDTTFPLTVLVRDLGNPNLPPLWAGPSTLSMTEDVDASFALADLVSDPDDTNLTFSLRPSAPLIVLAENATQFTLHAPPNFNGLSTLNISVFDSAGNALVRDVDVGVLPVNDPPTLTPLTDLDLFVHTGGNVTASALAADVDGDPLTMLWSLDGVSLLDSNTLADFSYFSPSDDTGTHTLARQVVDPLGARAQLIFWLHVFVGPTLTYHSPAAANLRVANGTTLDFEIRATDPDTPTLLYNWSSGPAVFGSGYNETRLSLLVAQSAPFEVLAVASDNGSFVGYLWHVTVEEVPTGLVTILDPQEGAAFPENLTAAVSAFIDPRLSDLNVTWSLDGAPFAFSQDARTPPLDGPHNYTLRLAVTGLYNGTAPYSTVLSVNFSALGPPPIGGADGPPAQSGVDLLVPLVLVVALIAGATALLLDRRHRRQPPA